MARFLGPNEESEKEEEIEFDNSGQALEHDINSIYGVDEDEEDDD